MTLTNEQEGKRICVHSRTVSGGLGKFSVKGKESKGKIAHFFYIGLTCLVLGLHNCYVTSSILFFIPSIGAIA